MDRLMEIVAAVLAFIGPVITTVTSCMEATVTTTLARRAEGTVSTVLAGLIEGTVSTARAGLIERTVSTALARLIKEIVHSIFRPLSVCIWSVIRAILIAWGMESVVSTLDLIASDIIEIILLLIVRKII